MKNNEKGFTLVELLAVIVILGLLMAIAIPSVTKYITQSRIKTLTKTMDSYITAVVTQVNDGEYKFSDSTKVFAIPIECVSLEKGGQSPFGNWMQANENYWAYVLVHYDSANYNYEYGFTFKDDAGYGLYPTLNANITNSMVKTGYDDLTQPQDGLAVDFVEASKWEGFNNITSTTELVVLESESEGVEGNGQTTCTLCQKGENYSEIVDKSINDRTLMATSETSITAFWGYRKKIKEITFQDSINIPNTAVESWDVSLTGNGKIMAFIETNISNPSYYNLYIQCDGKLYANENSSYLFSGFYYLDSINNIKLLNTSKVTNMQGMFNAAGKLSSKFTLDLGENFDTSKVIDMHAMFALAGDQSTIFTLKLGDKFDTSNVIDMSYMFNRAGYSSTVFTLDLGDKFDTSKVTTMQGMFNGTGYVNKKFTLDLGNKFDTSNVTDMAYMFGYTGYKSTVFTLDLGDKFDTSKVINMSYMFNGTGYTSPVFILDLGNKFDTSKVTNMQSMFYYAGQLSKKFKLDCSSWNVDNVTKHTSFNYGVTSKVTPPVWVN